MKYNIIIFNFIIYLLISFDVLSNEINITSFIKSKDTTPAVVQALKECKKSKAKRLIFPKGRYEFWPTLASETYLFISNNDEGLKRIAFDLSEIKNLEIDGQGSSFIFHGYVLPFFLNKSENITFKNFTIDYSRTFHSEGRIISAFKDSIDVLFSDQFAYRVNNYRLEFVDENRIVYPFSNLLEFDYAKKEVAPEARDYIGCENIVSKDLGHGLVRLYLKGITGKSGNVLTFNAQKRLNPAFVVSKSTNTKFVNILIYHAGGMGIIAQLSRDITLTKVKVTPTPNLKRMVSLTSDATHFVNCGGTILMEDCLFENQLDDATNVHGIYVRIEKIISSKELLVKLSHSQQFGIEFLFPKTKIEITNAQSLMPYTIDNRIIDIVKINKEYSRILLKNPLPNEATVGDIIGSLDNFPTVIIRNCTIRNNRARGILVGSRGKILVENNYFHNHAPAILMEGDGHRWFEQAGVQDLIIRNNIFDNCNYTPWGSGVISTKSGIDKMKRSESKYNRNILIEKNKFILCSPNILSFYSVSGLIYRNNTARIDTIYKVNSITPYRFVTEFSENIYIDDKDYN